MSQKRIVPSTSNDINGLLSSLVEKFEEPTRKLANHLYKFHNYSQRQVADIIERDPAIVSRKFPKEETL